MIRGFSPLFKGESEQIKMSTLNEIFGEELLNLVNSASNKVKENTWSSEEFGCDVVSAMMLLQKLGLQ